MTDFRDTIEHSGLLELYDYWDRIRGGRHIPSRRDMDPLDIPALLQNIVLLDVEYDPVRFRIRVHGTAVSALRGRDLTGEYLDAPGASPIADILLQANREIVRTRRPHSMAGPYPSARKNDGIFSRLGVPLSDDGERVDMI